MQNFGFIAADGVAAEITGASFDETTNLIVIQNNGANDIRVGFTQATTNVTDGVRIQAGESFPMPLVGGRGQLWALGDGAAVNGVVIKG